MEWLIILAIIFLGSVWLAVLEIPTYVVILAVIGVLVVKVLIAALQRDRINDVARAELIEVIAVYKERIENTGFSISWSGRSGRSYYRYKEVLDHYKCRFRVVYKNGKTGIIECRKDSVTYNELIRKGS